MRYLHPVGVSERFLASGIYVLHKDGIRQSEWSQEWAVHRLPDNSRLIRIDDDARSTTGRSVLIEAWINPPVEGGQIARMDFIAYGGRTDLIKRLRATYNFFDDHVEIGRTLNNDERRYEEIVMPSGYVRSAAAILFTGLTTAYIAEIGEERPVISNNSRFDSGQAFESEITNQATVYAEEKQIEIEGKLYEAFRYDRRIDGMTVPSVWLDENDVLLQCDTLSGETIILHKYAKGTSPL